MMDDSSSPRNGCGVFSPHHASSHNKKRHRHLQVHDPNMSNPRLLVNRPCIYERQLPGDAYITAYVQRLQHGYYSSPAVSDVDAEHVDFLAVSFVFHSPHTLTHRFKSATIRAGVHLSPEQVSISPYSKRPTVNKPRFLMHAPHLIYGAVSPETMEWTFSLAGSLGISETPVNAGLFPSGSFHGRYRRYEMMRIQGSVRTLKNSLGPRFNVEAGEIMWSLEENNLQRSGLPREFTFVMLIQKPAAHSRINLSLNIEPVIDAWWGSYPNWLLGLPAYRPAPRRGVDFSHEVGQKFQPVDGRRGFNFAALVSSFDDYIAMPGRKFTRSIRIPSDFPLFPPDDQRQDYSSQYGGLNPMQQLQGNTLANVLLETRVQRPNTNIPDGGDETETAPATVTNLTADPMPNTVHSADPDDKTIQIRVGLDPAMISQMSALRVKSSPVRDRSLQQSSQRANGRETSTRDSSIGESQNSVAVVTADSWVFEGTCLGDVGAEFQSYEDLRASMLRTAHSVARRQGRMASPKARRAGKPVNRSPLENKGQEENKA